MLRNILVRRSLWIVSAIAFLTIFVMPAVDRVRADDGIDYEQSIPPALKGPFFSRPDVMALLECPDVLCSGPLNFARLLEARLPAGVAPTLTKDNPFTHEIAKPIVATIARDIAERSKSPIWQGQGLNSKFLTHRDSRVELVGIINRMDRQFIKEATRERGEQRNCGEISVIYRFFYSIREGRQTSRLPVTMNLVFPALPSEVHDGKITCATIAQRWIDEISQPPGRTAAQIARDLFRQDKGPLAFISGKDLERVELNVQAYRAKASDNAAAGFGTRAEYVIRVFEWSNADHSFHPKLLTNQIDREALICESSSDSDCGWKQALRRKLVAYLQRPAVVIAVDQGELNIPEDIKVLDKKGRSRRALATRGISIAPGGLHRSGNQPFWGQRSEAGTNAKFKEIITDDEIRTALKNASNAGAKLNLVNSPSDFRIRLNQLTCTGCHQARAIAGFHFPGADREGTPQFNSVLLSGSPHFYGDQPRRMEVVKAIASSGRAKLTGVRLATSYADRPDDRFNQQLAETQMRGGWGATCIVNASSMSRRNWGCRKGLFCDTVFDEREGGTDRNGVCRPERKNIEIGDPLQSGGVQYSDFDRDIYERKVPKLSGDKSDTRIPPTSLPSSPPRGNSYYGAHQEYYNGHGNATDKGELRDAQTGGFPAGMLRMSECIGLPNEATCGLIAASGFNACILKMETNEQFDTDACFANFTAFAGMRACDVASPCRDDYICIRPIKGFSSWPNAIATFAARSQQLTHPTTDYRKLLNLPAFDPKNAFGETQPDRNWVERKDRRGYCIPPYFVFQFRSDGHPPP